MAAILAVEPAAVSHASAAVLHGLAGFREGHIHLVVPRGGKRATSLATVHESSWPQHTVVDGIRVVTLVDTLFQLAHNTDEFRLRRALGDAMAAHRDLAPALFDRYVDLAPKRLSGIRTMRSLLEDYDETGAPPASELELLLDQLLDSLDGLRVASGRRLSPGGSGATLASTC
jgi:predicted transcriptional regulator of viral defense system